MTTQPTGRLLTTDAGRDLILTRTYRAPIADVWASLTEPDRTARWYGPWTGEAGPGRNIKVQMTFEEGQPWMEMHIEACEPPHRLEVSATDEAGSWLLEVQLTQQNDTTEFRFIQHLTTDHLGMVSQVGPGWEYYLDMFGAAHTGANRPEFSDYYPAFAEYYENLAKG
ncbi:SRPBCC family protein [Nocardia sp. XZ_19_385]|uniref:SRPBCC family protein n=1 Tax=Nocardia sp. XZ_19_385 TaxID=2769488 RepID=UPI00188F3B47|nr:SRPBCC family protein [Nocardia sp. XZ_19_385]